MDNKKPQTVSQFLWNCWCCASIVGIWPRYIEPNIISTTHLTLKLPHLPRDLQGLKILQFSDLHLNEAVSPSFIRKMRKKINKLSPHIIVFTGDFLQHSNLGCKARLLDLLNSLKAPHGCYAILGNHDYEQYVSINDHGEYDIIDLKESDLRKGWKRLFKNISVRGLTTDRAQKVSLHQGLVTLLKETPFRLLHNENITVPVGNALLNICGLGEHMLHQCLPEKAFAEYDERYPGIILTHNPDSIPYVKEYPGDILLCGHTHGGQVNVPFLHKKFMIMENMHYKRGLKFVNGKWVYINRGLGGSMRFRWFSKPELLLLTLEPFSTYCRVKQDTCLSHAY